MSAVIDELDRWIKAPTIQASPVVDAWRTELALLRQTRAPWPFDQVYPNLAKVVEGQPAGAGWSVELHLLVQRFGPQVPHSCRVLNDLQELARHHHGPVRSSDQ